MKTSQFIAGLLLVFLGAGPLFAQQTTQEMLEELPPNLKELIEEGEQPQEDWFSRDLAEAAEAADLVALVQVHEADNTKVRDTVVQGRAILNVLIGYKGTERGKRIQVNDVGLRGRQCYYPERDLLESVYAEGHRFLVFLKKDEDYEPASSVEPPAFHGQKPSCLLPIYISDGSDYVVRHPIDGFDTPEGAPVETFDFRDPHAEMSIEQLSLDEQRRYVEELGATRRGTRLYFSEGILLYELRPYIFPQGLPRE
jgi:hypothetical protein